MHLIEQPGVLDALAKLSYKERRRAVIVNAQGVPLTKKERYRIWWALAQKKKYATAEQRAKRSARMQEYDKHPDRRPQRNARVAVYRAVKAGRLVKQPCACGRTDVQAHHHDYSKQLDVKWVCPACHTREHNRSIEQILGTASLL